MKNILIYAENLERANFFASLVQCVSFLNCIQVVFLTDKYSVYRFLIKKNLICYPISNKKYEFTEEQLELNETLVKKSINYLRNQVSLEQAIKILSSVEQVILDNKINPDAIFVFNGESFIDKYIISRFKNCKKLFFEVGNFPNRMFVDPKGVNAKSTIFERGLDSNPDYKEFDYDLILSEKKKNPPQSKLTISDKFLSWLWNIFGILVLNYHFTEFESPFCKLKMFLSAKLAKFYIKRYQTIDLEKLNLLEHYIFVPLQVSSDTQIVFNSDIDAEQLVDFSLRENTNVVIKFHPAERDYKEIKKIYDKYRNDQNVFFVRDIDTPTLIDKADKIITINSNVGLEAILQGKKVNFLGRTIYSDFDFLKSVTYINDFLLPISYPIVKEVDQRTENELYKRLLS